MGLQNKGYHLVLLRGLVREAEHWDEGFIEAIQKSLPVRKISKLDLPGAGIHHNKKCPLTIKEIVDFMRKDYLTNHPQGIKSIFISISMGAMIAIEWANRYPQDVQGLVLMNTSLGGISPFYHRLDPKAYPMVFSQPFTRSLEKKEASQLKVVSNREENYQKITKKWVEIQTRRPVSLLNKTRQLLAASRYGRAKKPKVPTLLMVGEQDRLVSPKCSYAIHKEWHIPLTEHSTAGHALEIDEPLWCAEEISRWINQEPNL